MDPFVPGIYEAVRTARMDRALVELRGTLDAKFADVDPAEAPDVIAQHVADAVRRALADDNDPQRRVALTNQLFELLDQPDESVTATLQQLLALTDATQPGDTAPSRPVTPLSQAALLTNAKDEPSLSAELRAELASADRVDLLCAFIRWHGLRVLEDALAELGRRSVPFRVLTTTYVGATERRAIDELVTRFGADVRISYETQSTRLHAKAWLFRRDSGYDTAFVGSSNLSRSALVDGLEWNVRLSGVATPELLRKFEATFDTYWESTAFESYDPTANADRLDDALAYAGNRTSRTTTTIDLSGLEVRALPHQQEILEALESERDLHDRHRNLVVAATGTGKTVVAALDYRRLVHEVYRRDLSLLFVAHRKEILHQSLRLYRDAMRDGAFGEAYVGGARPERWRHVFASIQSLSNYGVHNLPAEHFDVVVVDGGLEIVTTERSELVLWAYSDVHNVVEACGEGQPYVPVTPGEFSSFGEIQDGVVLVALDVWHPEGVRYSTPETGELEPLEELEITDSDQSLVWIPTRSLRAGDQEVRAELHSITAGQPLLLVYHSLEALQAGCGAHQAAAAISAERVEHVARQTGAYGVVFNAVLVDEARHKAPVRDRT